MNAGHAADKLPAAPQPGLPPNASPAACTRPTPGLQPCSVRLAGTWTATAAGLAGAAVQVTVKAFKLQGLAGRGWNETSWTLPTRFERSARPRLAEPRVAPPAARGRAYPRGRRGRAPAVLFLLHSSLPITAQRPATRYPCAPQHRTYIATSPGPPARNAAPGEARQSETGEGRVQRRVGGVCAPPHPPCARLLLRTV